MIKDIHKIYFNRSIIYNEYTVDSYDNDGIINISKCLYSNNINDHTKQIQIFDLETIIDIEQIVKIHKNQNDLYTVLMHPDIMELAIPFGYKFKIRHNITLKEAEQVAMEWKALLSNMLNKIYSFLLKREGFVSGNFFIQTNFLPLEHSKQFAKLIEEINKCFNRNKVYFNDYILANKSIDKEKYSLELSFIYNYKTARNFFKKLATQNLEYYNPKEYMDPIIKRKNFLEKNKEDNQEDLLFETYKLVLMEKVYDDLNIQEIFNKRTFGLITFYMEELIEKEEAINKFVYKVLNENLSHFEINNEGILTIVKKEM